jgi:hypothetical protein
MKHAAHALGLRLTHPLAGSITATFVHSAATSQVAARKRTTTQPDQDAAPMLIAATTPIKRIARAVCAATALFALLSCSIAPHATTHAVRAGKLRITEIRAAQLQDSPDAAPERESLARACKAWHLSEADAARFFALAQEYPDGMGDDYYWLPCSIKGRLIADGRAWEFEINAAATATWRDGDTFRRWGCSARACAPLALLMPDGNGP